MPSVYSTRFIGTAALTSSQTYTVPAGYRAVVRCVATWLGDQPLGAKVRVTGAGGATFYENDTAPAVDSYDVREMHVVLEEGESMTAVVDNGNADVTVSGYLLTLP